MPDLKQASITTLPHHLGYDVFLSYSRRDKAFSQKPWQALVDDEKRVWVDWNNLAPAEDWQEEMFRGIQVVQNFIFIISPKSLQSEHWCLQVIKHFYSLHIFPTNPKDV